MFAFVFASRVCNTSAIFFFSQKARDIAWFLKWDVTIRKKKERKTNLEERIKWKRYQDVWSYSVFDRRVCYKIGIGIDKIPDSFLIRDFKKNFFLPAANNNFVFWGKREKSKDKIIMAHVKTHKRKKRWLRLIFKNFRIQRKSSLKILNL